MFKWILSVLSFLISLASTGTIGFYLAIYLIGPHSDILPDFLHIPVGITLLLIIILIPLLIARKALGFYKSK
jgi:hypothetical protein